MSPQLKTTFSTDSRVQNMFDILLDEEMDKEKMEKVGILMIYSRYMRTRPSYLQFYTVFSSWVISTGGQQLDRVVPGRCRSRENLPEQRSGSAAQHDRDGQGGNDPGGCPHSVRNVHGPQSSGEFKEKVKRHSLNIKLDIFIMRTIFSFK